MFPDLRPNIHQHFLDLIRRHPPGYTSPKCSKEMSQCCLKRRALGPPHNASGLCICSDKLQTDYKSHLVGDQKGEKWWCEVQNVGCVVRDVPTHPVSLLADSVGGPSCTWMVIVTWQEIERLGWNITGLITLQFEFINMLFLSFLVTWGRTFIPIALMFEPDLSLSCRKHGPLRWLEIENGWAGTHMFQKPEVLTTRHGW